MPADTPFDSADDGFFPRPDAAVPPADDTPPSEETIGTLPEREDAHALTVVGIGASAGGVQALQDFFLHASPTSGSAFVVVLHLSPEHESHLAEVLARVTTMPVRQVRETVHLEANHVYVIPPAKHLFMEDGMLRLAEIDQPRGHRVAIDRFFRALADSRGPQSIAVVLSGAGMDGSLGIKQVKELGGLVVAQDPLEAEYDAMPRSAIATGLVDYVLPAREIARQIDAYWHTSRVMRLPHEAAPSPEQQDENIVNEVALRDILAHVRVQTGHDFIHYKRATVLRRIARRLQVNELLDLPSYLDFLRSNNAEVNDLVGDLLISVTQFFRDATAWEALAKDVIPRLFQDKTSNDEVRIWSCACATGEEAYSLAILLLEQVTMLDYRPRLLVFATDMDDDAITYAREGSYPETIATDVSEERLRRWFYRENGRYRVRKEVREIVLFASHDVLKDTPFSRLDLITCRNLLIYLNRTAQERVFETFHFALRPEGRLMLGSAEVVDAASPLFTPTDKQHRLYVRRPVPRLVPPLPTITPPALTPPAGSIARRAGTELLINQTTHRSIPSPSIPSPPLLPHDRPVAAVDLHRALLELYAPPSILVNEAHQIIHLSNGAAQYLRFMPGEPTANLLRVIQPELRLEVSTALYAAASEQTDQVRVGHLPGDGSNPTPLRIIVKPVLAPEAVRGYLLVMFDISQGSALPLAVNTPVLPMISDVEEATQRLEAEIARLQAQLHSTVEQYEASMEQLKASNEELQAMNEEMRSAAEELETSKEELQSINEELTTVNQELKVRVEEVNRSNSDLQNLLTATDIGTIFLDRDLRIKRFTPSVENLFNLIPTDLGRPLSHLTHKLKYDELPQDTQQVLRRLIPIEREVNDTSGRTFLARLLPYRTPDDRIEGVVVTFMDITERRRYEEQQRQADERFRAIVNHATTGVAQTDLSGAFVLVNQHLASMLGYTEAELLKMNQRQLVHPDDVAKNRPLFDTLVAQGTPFNVEQRYIRKDGKSIWVHSSVNAILGNDGKPAAAVAVIQDISPRKDAEEALRESEDRFRTVANLVPELLWSNAPNGSSFWYNQRWLEYTGQTLEEAVGFGWLAAIHPDDRPASRDCFQSAVSTGVSLQQEHRIRRGSDGEYRWFLVRAEPMRDAQGKVIHWFGSATDIHDQRTTREALEATIAESTAEIGRMNDMRQELLRRLVAAQEEEAARISRDLHDDTGQHITALLLGLRNLKNRPSLAHDPDGQQVLTQIEEMAGEIAQKSHRLSFTLRPTALDDQGLEAALHNYIEEWTKWSGVPVDFMSLGMGGERLPREIESTIYRVTQEALTNILRHATGTQGATKVTLTLRRTNDEVIAIVEDNGPGFDVEAVRTAPLGKPRLGLFGMQERATLVNGNLTIESTIGEGTTVFLHIPLGE